MWRELLLYLCSVAGLNCQSFTEKSNLGANPISRNVWLQLLSPRTGNFVLPGNDGKLWLCFLSIAGYFFSFVYLWLFPNSDESLEPSIELDPLRSLVEVF